MSKLRAHNIVVSLDGYATGEGSLGGSPGSGPVAWAWSGGER
jgi:hypothetical protein